MKTKGGFPRSLGAIYREADVHAKRALKSLRTSDIKKAKVLYYAATVYHELAEHNRREIKGLRDKMAKVLEEVGYLADRPAESLMIRQPRRGL